MIRRFIGFLWLSSCLASFAQEGREPVSVPEETMQRLLIRRVDPVLNLVPEARMQGTVVLKAAVDKSGDVENLQMVSGHPMLVPAALDAVKQWRYRPYEVNGIPVAVETTIRVEFPDRSETAGQSESSQSAGARVAVSSDKISGHIIRKVAPVYPPLARQARIQGTVILRVTIDKEGNVANLELVSGHPMLAPAAIEAVRQWRYTPYGLNGEIVEVETDVQVNFKLADDPPKTTAGDQLGIVAGGVVSGVAGNLSKPLEGGRVSEAVMRLRRVQKVDPLYPWDAIQMQIQGTVVLDVRVDSLGGVAEVVRMSGSPLLATAATEAVRQWKYDPYVRDGKSIAVVSTVRLNFSLTENQSDGVVSEPTPGEDAAPPQIQLPRRVRVSSGVSSGLLVSKVAPMYPPDARDERIQGTVVLQAIIDKDGNVSSLQLISGHPVLAPAAMEAVRQWRYRPYLLYGQPIDMKTMIRVNFRLAP